jgi:hypothetical protein
MSISKIRTRASVALLIIVGALVAAVSLMESSSYYEWQQKRMVQRVLAADPDELLKAGRQLLATRPGYVGKITRSSQDIPSPIRRLKPRQLFLGRDSVYMEFSDIANPFGLIAFTPGADVSKVLGHGSHQWIEGLWLFDDGQLERYGQPNGAANESQPFRPE